jgi:hypothetical protein
MFRRLLAALAVMAGVACGVCGNNAMAQGYSFVAGSSSLIGVNGVTVTKYDGSRTSMMSFGGAGNNLIFGAATEYQRDNGTLRYGDTSLGFLLPTDLDSAGRSVGARGVQWSHGSRTQTLRVFAGKSGNSMEFGYVNSIDVARWMGSVEWTKALSAKLELSALAAVGAAHAAMIGMKFRQTQYREFGASVGWNAGHPVASVSAKMRGMTWMFSASETVGRLQLRPDTSTPYDVLQYHVPEREGINFTLEKRLAKWMEVDASRVAYAKDAIGGLPYGAQMYDAGVTTNEGWLSQGLRGFESNDGDTSSQGVAFVARTMKQYWSFDASLMESWRESATHLDDGRTQAMMFSATRSFAGRYKLTGGADFAGSNPNIVAGAEIAGPLGTIGVTESMVYVPFGTEAGFTRVTMISLKAHPRNIVEGSLNMLMGKNVPWTYTAIASSFLERGGDGGEKAKFKARSLSVPLYVLRGVVVDQMGAPVADAAVRVGSTIVYTNDQGVWEYRQRKPIPVALRVDTEEFVTVRRYVTDEAAKQVVPQQDVAAKPIVMHVFYQKATEDKEISRVVTEDKAGAVGADVGKPEISQGLLGQFEAIVLHGGLE